MPSPAAGLIGRLVRMQLVAWGAAGLLVAAFAPRLLLLDPTVVQGSARIAMIGGSAILLLVVLATLIVGQGVRPVLANLAMGDTHAEPAGVHALYVIPSRLVAIDLTVTLAIGAATLTPRLRPLTNDVPTQAEPRPSRDDHGQRGGPAGIHCHARGRRARAAARRGLVGARRGRSARHPRAAQGPGAAAPPRGGRGAGGVRGRGGGAARARAPSRLRRLVPPERRRRAGAWRPRFGRGRLPRAQGRHGRGPRARVRRRRGPIRGSVRGGARRADDDGHRTSGRRARARAVPDGGDEPRDDLPRADARGDRHRLGARGADRDRVRRGRRAGDARARGGGRRRRAPGKDPRRRALPLGRRPDGGRQRASRGLPRVRPARSRERSRRVRRPSECEGSFWPR